MGTLFYSPGIRVLIEAQSRASGQYQIIDVSDDIANASLSLNQNAPHSFRVVLTNPRRKYDAMFTPNDRIIVQLRRVNWLQCFAGYLSDVPLYSVFSRSVQLTAECTLKRLRYHPYDSGTSAFVNLMNEFNTSTLADGGMTERIKAILTKVVGWEEEAIHIGRIPDLWVESVEKLYGELEPELSRGKALLGNASVTSGSTSGMGIASAVSGALTDLFGAGNTAPADQSTPANLDFNDRSVTSNSGLLRGHTAAAWQFIKNNWPEVVLNSGRRSGGGDHGTGSALDLGTTFGDPHTNNESRAVLNSVAMWFVANPQAFGLTQIIWRWKSNEGSGWHAGNWNAPGVNAASGGDDWEHIHHLHVAFGGPNQGQVGPMGNPWPGTSANEVDPNGVPPSGANPSLAGGTSSSSGPKKFVNANAWYYDADMSASHILTGYRVLMNDSPEILPLLGQLCQIGQRSYCSAPNGDFIAWFPDYFGLYGTAGRIVVEPVELMDFTVNWSDNRLKTHEFVVGSDSGYGSLSASAEQAQNQFITHGIASIDFPQILAALMNITEDDPIWGTPKRILDRFGARPETQPMANTTMFSTREMEFWAAIWKFTYNWATQFSSQIPLTFMPEAFPGMILEIPTFKFQAYIEQVTHTIDFADGAGFKTDVRVVAPSVTDGSGILGLVRGKSDPDKRLAIQATPLGTSQAENLPGQSEPEPLSFNNLTNTISNILLGPEGG